jgi:methyl-accepting chemotaxis protein
MKSLTLKQKIYLVGAIWSLITLICGCVVFLNMQHQTQIQAELTNAKETTQRFNNLLTIMVDMETGIRGYLLSGEDVYLEPFNAAEGLFDQEARATKEVLKDSPEQMKRLETIVAAKKSWIEGPAVEDMMARRKLSRGMIDNTAFIEGFKKSKGKELSDIVRQQVHDAIQFETSRVNDLLAKQTAITAMSKNSATVGILIAVIIGMTLLTVTIGRLNATIRHLVDSLLDQAQELSSVSVRLNQSSASLSKANTDTADALQQTSSAITEINSMAASNTNMIDQALNMAEDCARAAQKGREAVQRVIQSMEEAENTNRAMQKQFAENQKKLIQIVERIKDISSKTQVINEIVFQTKLLSFNASVEAARAGENGKGFAVVAEEVGNLANMSGQAAKEITDLLTENEAKIADTVSETSVGMEQLVKTVSDRVSDSMRKSQECRVVFDEIQGKTVEIQNAARQIATASAEQAKGVEEIFHSMSLVDKIVKTNCSMADNSSEMAKTLLGTSSDLDQKLFHLMQLFERRLKSAEPNLETENVIEDELNKAA